MACPPGRPPWTRHKRLQHHLVILVVAGKLKHLGFFELSDKTGCWKVWSTFWFSCTPHYQITPICEQRGFAVSQRTSFLLLQKHTHGPSKCFFMMIVHETRVCANMLHERVPGSWWQSETWLEAWVWTRFIPLHKGRFVHSWLISSTSYGLRSSVPKGWRLSVCLSIHKVTLDQGSVKTLLTFTLNLTSKPAVPLARGRNLWLSESETMFSSWWTCFHHGLLSWILRYMFSRKIVTKKLVHQCFLQIWLLNHTCLRLWETQSHGHQNQHFAQLARTSQTSPGRWGV
jgi:hypothetical protein